MDPLIREISRAEVGPLLMGMMADGLDVLPDEGTWLGALQDGVLAGAVRMFRRGTHDAVDDVWTRPDARRRGIATRLLDAAAERASPLWLICDEPDVAFYAARGFTLVSRAEFPSPLAEHYGAKREWPSAPDHRHFAMVRTAGRRERSSNAAPP